MRNKHDSDHLSFRPIHKLIHSFISDNVGPTNILSLAKIGTYIKSCLYPRYKPKNTIKLNKIKRFPEDIIILFKYLRQL